MVISNHWPMLENLRLQGAVIGVAGFAFLGGLGGLLLPASGVSIGFGAGALAAFTSIEALIGATIGAVPAELAIAIATR